ncbi:energy transducer TonB [Shewanella sp. NKUCC01_JLK]|uniref:energy transducer TonB n=1 Tax=Shewanella sp. NKUCC01_JLK TaxID=2842123 RepID=UPI001C5AAEE5|nr:energy transducer TonB [Shewanella sp. NKUCC01_JLK]MBW3517176.1 energy transducer TonB [Shewanella sp. NKUCC01_JLK]
MTDQEFAPNIAQCGIALLLAAFLHIALTAAVFWSPAVITPMGQAKAVGNGGIEISLGPAGSAASALPQTTAPVAEQKSEPITEQVDKPEPLPPVAKKVTPTPRPKPITPTPQHERTTQSKVNEQHSSPIETPSSTALAASANEVGQNGAGHSTENNTTNSGDSFTGGGLMGDSQDYTATLLAWLEQHKEYPRMARNRRQQGTVMLYFMLDRQGRVSASRIEQSSGYQTLDAEALKMLERAQPLPAIPDAMPNETLELVVPVQFFLR